MLSHKGYVDMDSKDPSKFNRKEGHGQRVRSACAE